jgi:hypothetical protein
MTLAISGVVQDDVSTTEKQRFSFKSVCKKMVSHESPLIEAVSGTEIDCMGKKIEVGQFCEKMMAQDPYYLRGYVDTENQEVICQSGKKVLFKYQCVKMSDKKICGTDAKISCKDIQKKLARRLDLIHFSFTKSEKGIRELNCYFESTPLKDGMRGSL